jgi:hypothetical protein
VRTLDGAISFSGIQNLTGGSAADDFAFTTATASVSGLIDGGNGPNTLDFSGRTMAVTVTMEASGPNKATATGGFTNIGTVIGNSAAANTLVGADTANVWDVTGANAGTLNATLTFSRFQTVRPPPRMQRDWTPVRTRPKVVNLLVGVVNPSTGVHHL